jgi:hypothetical protein
MVATDRIGLATSAAICFFDGPKKSRGASVLDSSFLPPPPRRDRFNFPTGYSDSRGTFLTR